MYVDLSRIDKFYKTPIGAYVQKRLSSAVDAFCANFPIDGRTVVCSAACYPYIDKIKQDAARLALQTPSYQDVWPDGGVGHYMMANRDLLPYRAEEIDYMIMIHDLEFAEDPDVYLRECWRVLKGEGRLFIVIPNRAGRWARQDNTPFGRGYPYTLEQLRSLLAKSHFMVDTVERALYFPPYAPKTKIGAMYRSLVERIGTLCCMGTCGVYIIEAGKHLYSPHKGLGEITAEKARSVLFPQPAATSPSSTRDKI